MLWIEMSRDPNRPLDNEWGLGQSLWSPTEKGNGNRWGFWDTLLRVEEGDTVLHLIGKDDPSFAGVSVADSHGYKTNSTPPYGTENYSENQSYLRVRLRDFTRFEKPFPIGRLFEQRRDEIAQYYRRNKQRDDSAKRRILPVVMSDRLQCLNGAYLTEVTGEWRDIVLNYLGRPNLLADQNVEWTFPEKEGESNPTPTIPTNSVRSEVEQRTGQKDFADSVKDNYNGRCCFPECDVDDPRFLVGAHIARWADVPELRGDVSNGLCLCVLHDKAFEIGRFTVDENRAVWADTDQIDHSRWSAENILPHHGEKIDDAPIEPSLEALHHHWDRVEVHPRA